MGMLQDQAAIVTGAAPEAVQVRASEEQVGAGTTP